MNTLFDYYMNIIVDYFHPFCKYSYVWKRTASLVNGTSMKFMKCFESMVNYGFNERVPNCYLAEG